MPYHDCPKCHMRPGSNSAVEQGCRCPVIDNGRGHIHPDWAIVVMGCPVHDAFTKKETIQS